MYQFIDRYLCFFNAFLAYKKFKKSQLIMKHMSQLKEEELDLKYSSSKSFINLLLFSLKSLEDPK